MIYKPQRCFAHGQTWCSICVDDDDYEARCLDREFEKSDVPREVWWRLEGVSSGPAGPTNQPESGVVGAAPGRPAADVIDDRTDEGWL